MQSNRINAFDGVRCIACLTVLASHVSFLSQGGYANRIFFVLCGFLSLHCGAEERFFSIRETVTYYGKRAIRILPSFYLILFGAQFFLNCFTRRELFENLLFLKSYSVWWFLQHTVVFYLCVPFLHILFAALKRVLRRLGVCTDRALYLFLSAAVYLLALAAAKGPMFALFGNGVWIRFQLDMFLIGMGTRYLYEGLVQWKVSPGKIGGLLLDMIAAGVLFSIPLTSCDLLKRIDPGYGTYYIGWIHPYLCAIAAAILILALALNREGLVSRILSHPLLKKVGDVSLLMYLSHTFMIPYIPLRSPIVTFLYLALECYAISCVIYNGYERPITKFLEKWFFRETLSKNAGYPSKKEETAK